jgi:ATP-dependent DNA helicase RecG
MASDEELGRIVVELQITKTDFQEVEVKASVNKLPVSIVESVSSFTNASGGTVVLGLSEKEEFEPSKGFSAHRMLDALVVRTEVV